MDDIFDNIIRYYEKWDTKEIIQKHHKAAQVYSINNIGRFITVTDTYISSLCYVFSKHNITKPYKSNNKWYITISSKDQDLGLTILASLSKTKHSIKQYTNMDYVFLDGNTDNFHFNNLMMCEDCDESTCIKYPNAVVSEGGSLKTYLSLTINTN